jgi:hypothetical protein
MLRRKQPKPALARAMIAYMTMSKDYFDFMDKLDRFQPKYGQIPAAFSNAPKNSGGRDPGVAQFDFRALRGAADGSRAVRTVGGSQALPAARVISARMA